MSPRPRVYKTEAIVLRTMDLGEADRVLTVLTPRLGKLRVIAKGVRRPRSRIGGGLQLFSDVQLVLAVGRTFDVVTSTSQVGSGAPTTTTVTYRRDLVRATIDGVTRPNN